MTVPNKTPINRNDWMRGLDSAAIKWNDTEITGTDFILHDQNI